MCNKNNLDISQATVSPKDIAKLNNYIGDGKISMKQAKEILSESWESSVCVDQIIKKNNVKQISDQALLTDVVKKLLEMHPKEVQDYKDGKEKLMGFFVGQIMKETRGKANPKILNQVLIKILKGV